MIFFKKKKKEDDFDKIYKNIDSWGMKNAADGTLSGFFQSRTYKQIAFMLFVFSAGLLLLSIIISAISGGNGGLVIGFFGLVAFISSLAGTLVSLYGHFALKVEGRRSWLFAFIPNVVLLVFFIVMYSIGVAGR